MEGLSADHFSGDSFSFVVYVLIPLSGEKPEQKLQPGDSGSDSTFLRVFLNDEEQWCLPPRLQTEIPEKLKTAVLKL
jgi:penicillin-binding protein 1C